MCIENKLQLYYNKDCNNVYTVIVDIVESENFMAKITINKLGPINFCELEIKDFMIFTGPQASGKSTISKSIFFFKNIKNLLLNQIDKRIFYNSNSIELTIKNRLIKEIRSCFLQTFGTTWCMDNDMSLEYCYANGVYIKISLKSDPIKPNYIWIEFSEALTKFIISYDEIKLEELKDKRNQDLIKEEISKFFDDDTEVIYIPAGRSMMTLLSSQLMFMYSVMNDDQKRSLDYCTQNYLERILQIKSFFSNSTELLIKDKIELTDAKINRENLLLCVDLMKQILHGEYRNVDGEERLQVANDRYVKINFASSGQQEAIWILNVIFYYLLNNRKSYFIIEEPESHLYPNAQKLITEIISLAKNDGNKILLTTHSPYILGTINNLLYANRISKEVDVNKLGEILHPYKWLDFKKISAYHIECGIQKSCLDADFEAIDNAVIDGASEEINNDYERMVELKSLQEMEED